MIGLFVGGPEHGKAHDIDANLDVWKVPVEFDLGLIDINVSGPSPVMTWHEHVYLRTHLKILSGVLCIWLSQDVVTESIAGADLVLDALLSDAAKRARA